jgi:hypothetical protein
MARNFLIAGASGLHPYSRALVWLSTYKDRLAFSRLTIAPVTTKPWSFEFMRVQSGQPIARSNDARALLFPFSRPRERFRAAEPSNNFDVTGSSCRTRPASLQPLGEFY